MMLVDLPHAQKMLNTLLDEIEDFSFHGLEEGYFMLYFSYQLKDILQASIVDSNNL